LAQNFFSTKSPEVDHLEEVRRRTIRRRSPSTPYPLVVVAEEAEAAAVEVEAAASHPLLPPGAPGGKLVGNPPTEFNRGTAHLADEFMNAFNLYRLTNVDAEQMLNPMKRATLLLGFIKGT
jgi:hypothetical protein